MLYGNKDWTSQKDVVKYGLIISVMGVLMYSLAGIPVLSLIY